MKNMNEMTDGEFTRACKLEDRRDRYAELKTINRPLGEVLRGLRLGFRDSNGKKVSQPKFAQMLKSRLKSSKKPNLDEWGTATISRFERGVVEPTSDMVQAYAEVCGVTVDFIYGREDEEIKATYALDEKPKSTLRDAVRKTKEFEQIKKDFADARTRDASIDALLNLFEKCFIKQHSNTIDGVNAVLSQDYESGNRVLDALMNFINSSHGYGSPEYLHELALLERAALVLKSKKLDEKIKMYEDRKKGIT